MTPSRTEIIVSSLAMVTLLIAGCIFPTGSVNHPDTTKNESVIGTTATQSAIPTQTKCPTTVSLERTNYSMWLTINPVRDHNVGESFEVNGTIQRTDRNSTEKIFVEVQTNHPGRSLIFSTIFKGFAEEKMGNCEVHPWFITINLSDNVEPGSYMISADTSQNSVSKLFNVTPRTRSSHGGNSL